MTTDNSNNKEKKTPRECLCGCGGTTRGGRFIPGHDAKLKKALLEAAIGGSKRAANKLEALGWSKFLDAKREKLAKERGAEAAAAADPTCDGEVRRRGGRRKHAEEITPVVIEPEASVKTQASITEENAGDKTPAN